MDGEEIKKLQDKKKERRKENGIWIEYKETMWSVIIGNRKKRNTSLECKKRISKNRKCES